MTWSGYLYNILTPPSFPSSSSTTTTAANVTNNKTASSFNLSHNTSIPNSNYNSSLTTTKQITNPNPTGTKNDQYEEKKSLTLNEEEEAILEISRNVSELHTIAEIMGDELDKQNNNLNRLDNKLLNVYDSTVQCTIKASQTLMKSAYKTRIDYIGRYQFKYVIPTPNNNTTISSSYYYPTSFLSPSSSSSSSSTTTMTDLYTTLTQQYFLAVDQEGSLILSTTINKSTYFDIYCKESNIYAIQNVKTMTFLTITLFGTIKAFGRNFGVNEELVLEIDPNEIKLTGIFFIKSNWLTNSGGWLQNPNFNQKTENEITIKSNLVGTNNNTNATTSSTSAYNNNNNTTNATISAKNSSNTSVNNNICLNSVTSSLSDRNNMALFLPLVCLE